MTQPPSFNQILEISARAGRKLSDGALTIATAESCTGGLLASVLTDVSGSSAYLLGGVVSYSNQAKMALLGVQEATLQSLGAVSAETAAEMAQGARALFASDLALSTTGIAGPTGGTPDKPVGTVYLHLSAPGVEWGEHHVWPYDRAGNKLASVAASLELALRYLESSPESLPNPNLPTPLDRPVIVEAEWKSGKWRPRAVWLENKRWEIVGWGRQTQRRDGGTVVMVEASGGARFELLVDIEAGQWRLLQAWWPRRSV